MDEREGFRKTTAVSQAIFQCRSFEPARCRTKWHRPGSRNCIVVTVDDGYADFYRIAFPLLCRYEIPCTFFVTTKFVAGRKWLWPDKLTWMLARCGRFPDLRVANQVVPGGNQIAAPRLWKHIIGLLQQIDADEVEGSLRELAKQLCLEIPERPVAAFEACSWEQLLEMEASGFVEVGGTPGITRS